MFVVTRRICSSIFKGGSVTGSAFLCSIPLIAEKDGVSSLESLIGSPDRMCKLIEAQADPLLAKEIFDLASRLPHFPHHHSTYALLLTKLGRAGHFHLMDSVLATLHSTGDESRISPSLFSLVIQICRDAALPEKARDTFYTMLRFNVKPTPDQFNQILQLLVCYRDYIMPALRLFKEAPSYGVYPNTESYNLLMRGFCLINRTHTARVLFDSMYKRNVLPDVKSYRILMQGLCRKSQVNTAVKMLDDMLNKGLVPDTLSYTTLLNTLCRSKKLREAYKLLSRMKVYACNPDVIHYNTVIQGFCREGRSLDACKLLADMSLNGCSPDLVSYRTLVSGLCHQGKYVDAKRYFEEMLSKGFSPHHTVVHVLVQGSCCTGLIDEACQVLETVLQHGETLVAETWLEVISRVCVVDDTDRVNNIFKSMYT